MPRSSNRSWSVSLLLAPALVALALGAFAPASCREPTYVTLKIDTDVPCADLQGTTVTVGRLSEIETRAALTTSTTCSPDGTIGSLVITPSGEETGEFAVRVVTGVKRSVEECKAPAYGEGCIVARRALRFVEGTPLTLPVSMRAACAGRACGPEQTCVKGTCVEARIADSASCTGAGCGEDVLAKRAPTGGDGGAISGCDGLTMDFAPSNLDKAALEFPKSGTVSIDKTCAVDGETGVFNCLGSGARGVSYEYKRVATPAGDIAVFSMCELRVQPAAIVDVRGNLPIVMVALGKVEIFGSISGAAPEYGPAVGGGASSLAMSKGGGLGGGNFGTATTGAGGGGFCGRGGNGGQFGAPGPLGGSPNGAPELIPLIAGSAGASSLANRSGGGGAIQIVAGASADVASSGRVNMGGGPGHKAGSGGGGSGGAILIEAPSVTIAGVLAANGGGGASGGATGTSARPGEPSDQPAAGGVATDFNGGRGSGGNVIDGASGERLVMTTSFGGGGGGGGAGRIRINSRAPAVISGVVSPALTTPCATLGPLRP